MLNQADRLTNPESAWISNLAVESHNGNHIEFNPKYRLIGVGSSGATRRRMRREPPAMRHGCSQAAQLLPRSNSRQWCGSARRIGQSGLFSHPHDHPQAPSSSYPRFKLQEHAPVQVPSLDHPSAFPPSPHLFF